MQEKNRFFFQLRKIFRGKTKKLVVRLKYYVYLQRYTTEMRTKNAIVILALALLMLSCASLRSYDYTTEKVSFANQNLKRIPSYIKRYKNLKELDLQNNRIKHIPAWVASFDSLNEINLNNNQLRLTRSDIRHIAKVERLLMVNNGIEKLPGNVGKLQCKTWVLMRNKLSSLPESFGDLKQIGNVILYENNFESIPECVGRLKTLRQIDFYKNHIKEIPEFMGGLENLEQIYLSFNEIEHIPDTLRNLKKLKYFYIHHNNLKFLPEWIVEMDSIQRFGVGYNKLLALPDLAKMKSLYELDCEHNLLDECPWSVVDKPGMQILVIRDNFFKLTLEEELHLDTLGVVY